MKAVHEFLVSAKVCGAATFKAFDTSHATQQIVRGISVESGIAVFETPFECTLDYAQKCSTPKRSVTYADMYVHSR